MISLHITNVRRLMKLLLSDNENAFDSFLLSKAEIVTSCTFTIDGHFRPEFYTTEEIETLKAEAEDEGRVFSEHLIRYNTVKSQCFQFIKGSRTPVSFKFELYLADENIEKFIKNMNSDFTISDVAGLSVNLIYDGTKLICTTGTNIKIFTLDRSLDKAWDDCVRKFFDKWEISYEDDLQ